MTTSAIEPDDHLWVMIGDLAPTASEIQAAAMKWCGDKDRETFASDAYYFRENWTALNGLKAYVAREVAARTELAVRRINAIAQMRAGVGTSAQLGRENATDTTGHKLTQPLAETQKPA